MFYRTASLLALFAMSVFVNVQAQYVQGRDLIALHFDHAPDRDDGHAAAASLVVAQARGLSVIVVGGTYGRWNADRYVADSEALMDTVWGDSWHDAHNHWAASVAESERRWRSTLEAGGDIWIAEGGQSDFTADILRALEDSLPELDTRNRVHLVQHSDWNEDHADASDLDYVRAKTRYIRIEDGNHDNQTADLNRKSAEFVITARSSQQVVAWNAAFDYLDPDSKLDFSDTVELLYIVSLGKAEINSVDDFADYFMRQTRNSVVAPSSPTYWSDSYSVGGQCYCDTGYDHDIGSVQVSTPAGNKTVRQVCRDIAASYGSGSHTGRVYYNTVQCGHGPANSAADERDCPGIYTDSTGTTLNYRCFATGASWNLNALYGNGVPPGAQDGVDGIEPCQSASSDSDGDGFGWENGQSCIVLAGGTGGTTGGSGTTGGTSGTTSGGSGHPSCTQANADPDGDGYGWEDGATCVMGGGSIGIDGTTGGSGICLSAASDPDGDGYGWENNRSCRVVPTGGGTDGSGGTGGSGRPQCSSALSDPDGDGYGWENGQTCLVR